MTFGFQSAVDIATDAIDCIHTTATSHSRVFIVEVMGHKVGWLTLHAGIAGGADIILIPEIPYDIDKVVEAIEKRNKAGKRFTIPCSCRRCDFQRRCRTCQRRNKRETGKEEIPVCSYEIADQIRKRDR